MWFLNTVPKQVWIGLVLITLYTTSMAVTYHKGLINGRDEEKFEWEIREQKLVNDGISKGLLELNTKLQKALDLKASGTTIISSLESSLNTAKDRADTLQEKLDELLKTPPNICDAVPDDEFRLYQELFNQTKPD